MYPEHYRKSSEHVKGSNVTTPEPFCIGFISSIVTRSRDKLVASGDICLRVKKMYRPENTHRDAGLSHQLDLNQIYWTDEGDNFIIQYFSSAFFRKSNALERLCIIWFKSSVLIFELRLYIIWNQNFPRGKIALKLNSQHWVLLTPLLSSNYFIANIFTVNNFG